MLIGEVWIYRLLFVFVSLFVCTVTDFFGNDKASGVKFCMVARGRPGHFGELCSQKPKMRQIGHPPSKVQGGNSYRNRQRWQRERSACVDNVRPRRRTYLLVASVSEGTGHKCQ